MADVGKISTTQPARFYLGIILGRFCPVAMKKVENVAPELVSAAAKEVYDLVEDFS